MLTPAEQKILVDQLKIVFSQFIESDQHALVHAIVRLSVESLRALVELEQSLLDVADAAGCGPQPAACARMTSSEVRCPNCKNLFWFDGTSP